MSSNEIFRVNTSIYDLNWGILNYIALLFINMQIFFYNFVIISYPYTAIINTCMIIHLNICGFTFNLSVPDFLIININCLYYCFLVLIYN